MNTNNSEQTNKLQKQVDFLTKKLSYIRQNTETIIKGKNITETIHAILLSIREYYNADSAYIFEINHQNQTIINTYETYADGVDAEKQHTAELPYSFLDFWQKEWGRYGHLCVQNLAEYKVKNPELATPYIQLMLEQGIHSLVYAPLLVNNTMNGFIGVDNARNYSDDIDFIITMGHYISLQLAERQQEQELHKKYKYTKAFINSISNSYIFTAQVNVTRNFIKHTRGTEVLVSAKDKSTYTDNMELYCAHMDRRNERVYKKHFSRQALLKAYAADKHTITAEIYYHNAAKHFIWARTTALLTKHPVTGDIIAFLYQEDVTREKIQDSVLHNVTAHEYDYIMCIYGLENSSVLISKNPNREDSQEMINSDDYQHTLSAYVDKYCAVKDRERFIAFLNPDNLWQKLQNQDRCSASFCIYIDGKPRYKKLDVYCINKEYRLFVHVRSDFTETYQLKQEQEKKLRQALMEANRANAAKGDFLSRMSHDIRTPLNGIIGMTALARTSTHSVEALSYLDKIDVSSHFLLSLVNDILDLTKIDSGKIDLNPEPYSERDFIAYINSVIRPMCEEKQITLQADELCEPRWILVDKLRYNQIFFNLLCNAIKFTPNGGHISLQAQRKIHRGKMLLTAIIEDNGIGMSEEFQKSLFQPFAQAHTQNDEYREGSGMGLSIAYRIIRLMNGTLSVESALHKGTKLTIYLPLTLTETPSLPPEQAASLKIMKGTQILVAEDNEINGDILKLLLERKGMVVTVTHNGKEAIDTFKNSHPFSFAAILMDVRMPEMDGITATKAIRSLDRPDAERIPIIATTANAYGEDIKNCLEAGMNSHMSKPIEAQDLYNLLDWYLTTP